jgi:hypothetical protein
LSANFILQSGRPITYPESKYTYLGLSIPEYNERNANRLPAYHRLDFSATYVRKNTKKWRSQWVFGLYNVYNRQNAASITFREETIELPNNFEVVNGVSKAYKLTFFGIVPSITYEFKF